MSLICSFINLQSCQLISDSNLSYIKYLPTSSKNIYNIFNKKFTTEYNLCNTITCSMIYLLKYNTAFEKNKSFENRIFFIISKYKKKKKSSKII